MRIHPLPVLWAVLSALLLASCGKEILPAAEPESRFSLLLEEEDVLSTKTLLQSADIESRIPSVTLGIYQGGRLVEKAHFGSGFNQMSLPLEDGTYTVYALANMGDMQQALPNAESSLSNLSYTIPGYLETPDGIEYRGIPMAGSLTFSADGSSGKTIPVKRLLAKVTVQLSCEWTGAIDAVKIYNLNRKLKPFGNSAAASASDILPVQEFHAGTGLSTGTFVFYVPENLQGTVSGISDSSRKSPEGNSSVNSKKDRLTYLETSVSGTSGVQGSITYRSFLGSNATSDFNIRRNCRYNWTLHFLPDDRQYNDWKHDNGLSWYEYSYSITPDEIFLYDDESDYIQVYRQEYRYVGGRSTPYAGPSISYGNQCSWSYYSPSNPSVQNDYDVISGYLSGNTYYVTGRGPGTRRVKATTPSGESLYCDVTGLGYKRQLLMVSEPGPQATVGETIRLRALVYTVQDGITSGGVDVIDDIFNCSVFRLAYEGSTPVHYSDNGDVTADEPESERFSAKYYCADDRKYLYASGFYVEFSNFRTGGISLSGNEYPGSVNSYLQLHAYYDQYVNGDSSRISWQNDITNRVEWSIQDGPEGFHVSSSGRVSSTEAGAALVLATYTSPDGTEYQNHTIVVFNDY